MVQQRSVVEVDFDLPQGKLRHPVIVLSNNEAIQLEDYFVGVMLTTEGIDDEYSFPLEDFMLNKPLPSKSQVRLHLLGWFSVKAVIKNSHYNCQINVDYFNRLVDQIRKTTLSI